MKIGKHPNPFKQFMKSCGHDVSHVPSTSQDCLFGMSSFFQWTEDYENADLFVIPCDGFASDVMFDTWEKYKFIHTLIPDYIADNIHATVLFENGAEGHCDKNIFEFIHQVTQYYDLPNVFYANSCVNISEIHKLSAYDTFDVLYARNYKEDNMLQLDVNQHFDFDTSKPYLFNCLNNAPRPHRALLLGAMLENNLNNNIISSPNVNFDEVVSNTMQYVAQNFKNLGKIKTCISYLDTLKQHYPLSFDNRDSDVVHMKSLGNLEGILQSDIQIVTETNIGNELYFTEKIFKPIIMKQPFIIFGPNRIYQHLQDMGYKTYAHLNDNLESYDTEKDLLQKINMLIDMLETLMIKKDNPVLWQEIVLQNKECAEHNFNLFQKNSDEIIEKINIDLDHWLEVYFDFAKIFKKG